MYLHRKIHHTAGVIFQVLLYLRIFPRKWETRRNYPSTPDSRGLSFCLISTFTWRVLSLSQIWGRKLQPSAAGQRYHITRDVSDYSTVVVGLRLDCFLSAPWKFALPLRAIYEKILGFMDIYIYIDGSIWLCWKIHMLYNMEWSSFYTTLILGVQEIAGSIWGSWNRIDCYCVVRVPGKKFSYRKRWSSICVLRSALA